MEPRWKPNLQSCTFTINCQPSFIYQLFSQPWAYHSLTKYGINCEYACQNDFSNNGQVKKHYSPNLTSSCWEKRWSIWFYGILIRPSITLLHLGRREDQTLKMSPTVLSIIVLQPQKTSSSIVPMKQQPNLVYILSSIRTKRKSSIYLLLNCSVNYSRYTINNSIFFFFFFLFFSSSYFKPLRAVDAW